MKRVFLTHGWQSSPEKGILPWLKTELTNREFEVFALSMPEPEYPKIETWVPFYKHKLAIQMRTQFYLVILLLPNNLRYLQTLTRNCWRSSFSRMVKFER